MSNAKRFLIIFHFVVVFLSSAAVQGAPDDVDAGFNPRLTVDLVANYTGNIAIQPDGKIIVFGFEFPINRPYFNRLNPDGTIDPTFNCPACLTTIPTSVAFQADGKILIGGQNKVVRVNQDGSSDIAFKANFAGCIFSKLVPQPDGGTLFACSLETGSTSKIRRLNGNGALDPSFTPIDYGASRRINALVLLPDGKFLAGGRVESSNSGWIHRFNTDGSIDPLFQSDVSANIADIELTSDGKYMIVGTFTSINAIARDRIAKLLSDGNPDMSFSATPPDGFITGLEILPNGQFYLHSFITLQQNVIPKFSRNNADGSWDFTFTDMVSPTTSWDVDGQDRIVTFRQSGPNPRYYRLNFNGNIDFSFSPGVYYEGGVNAAAFQSDGKIVVGGLFTKANGIGKINLARLNPDGTTDTSFNVGTGLNGGPNEITVQPDGKILVGGNFSSYDGTTRTKLARINTDGSLDASFDPILTSANPNWSVYAITPTADGKILIGGNFMTVNGVNQVGLARLNADGSLDTSFTPPTLNATAITDTILVLPNGQILAGGNQTLYRLNSNGVRDTSFNLAIGGRVSRVIPQADGKYLVSYFSNSAYALFRCNNDGSFDFSFQSILSNNFSISTMFQQANGNIVVGGQITLLRGTTNLARFGPNGQLDNASPIFGANGPVYNLFGQADGKILVFGQFSGIEDRARSGIARISFRNSLNVTYFDYDGDGRSDVSVYRPSGGGWYALRSSDNGLFAANFGLPTDKIVPADYDGDGKTDVAVFRDGNWYLLRSVDSTFVGIYFGQADDVPVPADFDGDAKADQVVFRNGTWIFLLSRNNNVAIVPWGLSTDIPIAGNFNNDIYAEMMVYRPSNGTWYRTSLLDNTFYVVNFGIAEDKPVSADYDGDGIDDIAVYRPSTGSWYRLNSSDDSFYGAAFGISTDKPVPGDYDGDGKTDIAVFRPSSGTWYMLQSTNGFGAINWGVSTDIPTESAYIR